MKEFKKPKDEILATMKILEQLQVDIYRPYIDMYPVNVRILQNKHFGPIIDETDSKLDPTNFKSNLDRMQLKDKMLSISYLRMD